MSLGAEVFVGGLVLGALDPHALLADEVGRVGEGLALVAVASLSEHSGEGGVGVIAEDEDDVLVVDEVNGVDAEGLPPLVAWRQVMSLM